MPNIDLSILNQRQTPAFYADTLANRPAAGFVGRIFVSTNTFAFYRDNGTGWDLIGGPGTGTITGTGASGQIALWNGASTITGDTGLTYNGTDNSLTASKFIVTGGTSSQFLKGDGSLDSNAYLTTNIYNGNGTLSAERTVSLNGNNLIFDGGASIARVRMDADTNVARIFSFATNNLPRWAFRIDGTESGSDAGSDFAIRRYNDAGTFVDAPLTVTRSTGQSTFAKKVVIENNAGDQQLQIVSTTAPSLRFDNLQTGATKRAGLGISTAVNNFIQGSADRDFCIFNGSTAAASPILFGIYDAAAVNVQEAARISPARNFLVGTIVDAGYKLDVNGSGRISGNTIFSTDSATKVGIGTTTLTRGTRAVIKGPFTSFNGSGNGQLAVISDDNGVNPAAADVGATIVLGGSISTGDTDRTFVALGGYKENSIDGNRAGYFVIGTRQAASPDDIFERARVTSTGNFLIGTTTDAGQKLQVSGSAAISSNLNLGFSGNGPTINTPGGLVTVLNMNSGLIFSYQSSVPSPYTQDIQIDIVFNNWGSNPVIALVDLIATLREFAGTSGVSYGKVLATSPSTSTFSTFDTSNITSTQSSVTASSGGNYTLRININPTSSTDVYGIYMNIQNGGIGTAVSSITISYV
jgi:hypothetical protein